MRRPVPSSLLFLAALFALAIGAAVAAGVILYAQTQQSARVRAEGITGGSAKAGKAAMLRYGCGGCHEIPGLPGAAGQVGPALASVATRAEIAGTLPNDPAAMQRWLMHPQRVVRGNGMPEQGVTPRDARDLAAYLYTLD